MTDEEIAYFQDWFPLTREMVEAGFIPQMQAHWIEWFVAVNDDFDDNYEKAQSYNRNSKTRDLPEDIYLAQNGRWFVKTESGWAWINNQWHVSTQVHYEIEEEWEEQ